MICRGGVITGDITKKASPVPRERPAPIATIEDGAPAAGVGTLRGRPIVAIALLSGALAVLPGRSSIPPLVESDYCYLLTAADRLYDGHGLTAPPPVAPNQPWEWTADWVFLTQWPMGYPLLVCAARMVFGVETLAACAWISLVACATALVGWYLWVRRCVPDGISGVMLAAVAAGCAVSTASLLNPSTDVILVALLPFVLMMASRATDGTRPVSAPRAAPTRVHDIDGRGRVGRLSESARAEARGSGGTASARAEARGSGGTASARAEARGSGKTLWPFVATGLLCGLLFWIRYAALFVPIGIGAFFVIERLRKSHVGMRHLSCFAAATSAPILALIVINRAMSEGTSVQAQLNLGRSAALDLSADQLLMTWRNFTHFRFYEHQAASRWLFSLWPIVLIGVGLAARPVRHALARFLAVRGVMLSVCMAAALLAMLLVVTAVFGDKYDYVSLARYYVSAKPLYFVIFVAPLLLIPRRVVRAVLCVLLLFAASWLVQQEWGRPFQRWQAAEWPRTPYGQWANCFGDGAAELYRWIAERRGDDLIVVSNFHEYITLETKIPALPIPKDPDILDDWIERIAAARGVSNPRVVFVLDRSNRWRDYWIAPPERIISDFGLHIRPASAPDVAAGVFVYSPGQERKDARSQIARIRAG